MFGQQKDEGTAIDYVRQKRESYRVSLRRERLCEEIASKRFKPAENLVESDDEELAMFSHEELEAQAEKLVTTIQDAPSSDLNQLENLVMKLRRRVSAHDRTIVGPLLREGFLDLLCSYLKKQYNGYHTLQKEAAWILTNLCNEDNEFVELCIEKGVLNEYLRIFPTTTNQPLREQVLWGLANILGDDIQLRNEIIEKTDIIERFLLLFESVPEFNFSELEVIMWAISNLTRGKPYPSYFKVKGLLPFVADMLHNSKDINIISPAIKIIGNLTNENNHQIHDVLDLQVADRIIEFLYGNNSEITESALVVVGNLLSGEDYQIQIMVDAGVLLSLERLLDSPRAHVRKSVIWMISNLLAGNFNLIQAVLNTQIFTKMKMLLTIDDYEIQREIIFCYSNATKNATLDQLELLVEKYRLIDAFLERLEYEDKNILLPILSGLSNLFERGEAIAENQVNPYVRLVERLDGARKLEKLQLHPCEEVYNRVYELIERYFTAETSN